MSLRAPWICRAPVVPSFWPTWLVEMPKSEELMVSEAGEVKFGWLRTL